MDNKKNIPEKRFPEFKNDGEWEKKKLSQVGNLVNGLTYSPNDVSSAGILVLRSSNIKKNKLSLEDNVYVNLKINEANLSKIGDILICVRNGSKSLIGKNALIKETLPETTHGAFMTVFRSDNYGFVSQLFQSDLFFQQVHADLGATINSINGKNLLNYQFDLPTNPKEQQKIADCLLSLDEVIEAQEEKLKALQLHKKGLMQNLFPQEGETVPKYRFPEFKKDGDWVKKELGKVTNISTGGTPSSTNLEYWNGTIPWMNSGELNNKKIYSVSNFITEIGLKESSTKLIPESCVLIGLAGQGKTRGTAAINYIELCTNQSIGAIHPNFKIFSSEFLYYKIDSMYEELRSLSAGDGGRGGLNLQMIKSIKILFPKISEQQKIASSLSSIDDLITSQQNKIDNLKLHKKGLMQVLFPQTN